MAGKDGFFHSCTETKIKKTNYRCTLMDSCFSDHECRMIWDFYVSKSFAAESAASIKLENYGWKSNSSKTDGLPALESLLVMAAGMSAFCIIRNKTIKDTLEQMDLSNDSICVEHPRVVVAQNFAYVGNENEELKIDSKESRINALFRHIRNAFAHGGSYFFPNDMCLLEDKDGERITAEILIPRMALLEWIGIVDKSGLFYNPNPSNEQDASDENVTGE